MRKDFKEILEEVWPDYVLGKAIGHGPLTAVYEAHRRDDVAATPSAIKVIPVPTGVNEVEEMRRDLEKFTRKPGKFLFLRKWKNGRET